MCGRYTLRYPERLPLPAELLRRIDDGHQQGRDEALLLPRYNIAPGQRVLLVDRDADGDRRVGTATWGFRPRWLSGRRAPINARAEGAADKPMFRGAFRRGRCLVPADGWYEWQARAGGPKQPFFFHRPDDAVLWLAALAATDAAGERTMALLTTGANAVSRPVHERMPLVLGDDAAAAWIEPGAADATLRELLAASPDEAIEAHPVARTVNRPENDTPDLVQPLGE